MCAPAFGHNPIARASVSILLVLLILQAATGLVLAGTDIYYPPFGHWIANWIAAPGVDPSTIVPYDKTGVDPGSWDAMRSLRSVFLTIHHWNFYALLVVIVLHITGVVVTELREGGGVVSAMFTGKRYSIGNHGTMFGHPLDEIQCARTESWRHRVGMTLQCGGFIALSSREVTYRRVSIPPRNDFTASATSSGNSS